MFVRKSKVNQNGKSYTYLQLVHNRRDPSGKVKTDVILKLGREDLISSSFVSDMVEALTPIPIGLQRLMIRNSSSFVREVGLVWFLNELWHHLGMGKAISSLVEDRKFETLSSG